jgi:hypothetical protein
LTAQAYARTHGSAAALIGRYLHPRSQHHGRWTLHVRGQLAEVIEEVERPSRRGVKRRFAFVMKGENARATHGVRSDPLVRAVA